VLRVLHTSDWHLGHRLHDVPRLYEQKRFLQWLLETIDDERIDALLIAGDVFDTANPPSAVLRMYYDFLGTCAVRHPDLEIVIIGGNHDSPGRLDAPSSLARSLGIHVVGGLPRSADGVIDVDRMLVPLTDRLGAVSAWAAAVPFLRPADLRGFDGDGLAAAIRALYAQVVGAAVARRKPGQAIVAMGHMYAVGGTLSAHSERKIQVGYVEAVEADIFAPDVAYAALGHLHRPQTVKGDDRLRYCGSPIPLAMDEEAYPHQVRLLKFDGEALAASIPLRVPVFVELLAVPKVHAPIADVLEALSALPRGERTEASPYLEVRVLLETIEPRLRARVEAALEGAAARLVRIDPMYTGSALSLGDQTPRRELKNLTVHEVFEACYARQHTPPAPDDLVQLFDELLESVQDSGRDAVEST